jgi:hypothetical protein
MASGSVRFLEARNRRWLAIVEWTKGLRSMD